MYSLAWGWLSKVGKGHERGRWGHDWVVWVVKGKKEWDRDVWWGDYTSRHDWVGCVSISGMSGMMITYVTKHLKDISRLGQWWGMTDMGELVRGMSDEAWAQVNQHRVVLTITQLLLPVSQMPWCAGMWNEEIMHSICITVKYFHS